jgi:UDP-N-acetylglucosamine transferase subunit ALG13
VIFVTVGTQLPFERLVAAVDDWSGRQSTRPDVLAQVGAGRADYPHVRCVRSLDGARYSEAISAARLIVAHAGTGSILTALDRGLPVIIVPRDHLRGEHRDDHQIQTARQLERMGLVTVAWSETDLPGLIEQALTQQPDGRSGRRPNTDLVDYLREYLQGVLRNRN